jgi:hypothetical protein
VGGTFRSLRNPNYRLWAGGALISNVGTWMQRTAQDWLVLTQLTHNNASAVGVVKLCNLALSSFASPGPASQPIISIDANCWPPPKPAWARWR